MTQEIEASVELQKFMALSLGLGMDNLKESGSLIPMVLSVKEEEFSLCVLSTEGTSALEAAAKYLSSLPTAPDRYAVIFNGQIGDGNSVTSAVIAHVGERGELHSHTVFQSYDCETFSALGRPEYVGLAEQVTYPATLTGDTTDMS